MKDLEQIKETIAEHEATTGKPFNPRIKACIEHAERSEAIEASELTPSQKKMAHLASTLKTVEEINKPPFQNGGVRFKPQ